ncbi:MAG: carbohydrate-binding family 9-like protein [Bryobacteraceae bacterium]
MLLAISSVTLADGPGLIGSFRAKADFELTADPTAASWKNVKGVFAERGPRSEPVPGHRMEVRSRWTARNLYFLFICPYEQLYLKENPSTATETNMLWEWDVAEAFIGADFEHIRHYREFQVSPQGEWVDLDIDLDHSNPANRWLWNSGMQVKARIDREQKVWCGEMKIPIASIDSRAPAAGHEMRINLFRIQGPPPKRKFVAWQPTSSPSYHVPEAFGKLRLLD